MFVGVTEIVIAELSIIKMLLSTLILIVMINASQLILIGVYLFISDRADRVLQSIDAWITRNNRRVAAIVSLIGIFLLWDGITSLRTI